MSTGDGLFTLEEMFASGIGMQMVGLLKDRPGHIQRMAMVSFLGNYLAAIPAGQRKDFCKALTVQGCMLAKYLNEMAPPSSENMELN